MSVEVATAAADSNKIDSRPAIVDLFAGVGGLSLGAARAGFNVALAVENDPHAVAAHTLNFPNSLHASEDAATINGEKLLELAKLKSLDGIVGGPPCQGFSHIGRRQIHDSRNSLFSKFFQLVRECEPKFFLAENVLGILDSQYDSIRKNAFDFVSEKYHILEPLLLNASEYGAPTTRTRVFFIGFLKCLGSTVTAEDILAAKSDRHVKVADALFGLPVRIFDNWLTEAQSWRWSSTLPESVFANKVRGEIPFGVGHAGSIQRLQSKGEVSGCFGTRHTEEVKKRFRAVPEGGKDAVSKCVRLKSDGFCPTLRAGTAADKGSYQAVRPIHYVSSRVITPREAARLQGFPDWFQFAPTKWHSFRQIGNSVSPILAEAVLRVIHEKIFV